ncbi:MAG TPA: 50S ribosomal protein L11 methyltransferase [Xanthobacteraceae bacterium]|nr:50S ribosomal protein L11 methyltransferase [Xanthobacteraceae bacterium]
MGATWRMWIALPEEAARRAMNILADRFAELPVAAFESDGGQWTVEVSFASGAERKAVLAALRDTVGEPVPAAVFEKTRPQDWVSASLAGLPPVQVGRFVVHGAHDRGKVGANQIGIEIEAALAFGTGHHGTTRGCLAAIERHGKTRRPRRVLDVGTGTGVLAIAAARAFRRPVAAGDFDPVAVATARANVRMNRAGSFVRVVQALSVNAPAIRAGAPYDFVLANILLPVLQRLARLLRTLLARRATVVLSGLLPEHAGAAVAAFRAQGLTLIRRETLEGWTTLTLAR